MKIAHSSVASEAFFRSVLPSDPRIKIRPMFGNLSGFVNGNMFTGVYGEDVFVEVEKRSESTLPQDTTELWLQAQVSKRQSSIENVENDGGTIASSPSGTIQVYSEASQEGTLVESTPTTKSESSS